MKRCIHLPILLAFLALPACSFKKTSLPYYFAYPSSITSAPTIASDNQIRTLAAYTRAFESSQKSLPKSLTETPGPQRLISAVRALAACKSEPARAYARALIQLLRTYDLDAGWLPPTGTATVTYAELATVDALSEALMRGPESKNQGPAPAGPNAIPYSLHQQILVLISRNAPTENAAIRAAFNTANPLPADVFLDTRFSAAQSQQLYCEAWANLRARYTDTARPVNLTCIGAYSTSGVFGYALYFAGNALASTPELPVTGHELQDLVKGYARISQAVQALDSSIKSDEDPSAGFLDELLKFARIIDDNIAITRIARSDLTRFFNALAANDDPTVKALSSNSDKQTAAQWRDYFGFDRPNPVKALAILNLGITEKPGRISVALKKTDTAGKIDTDQHYVTVRKENDHWLIIEG